MIFLPLMTLAAAFALLCVNNTSFVAFHYLFISFTGLQSVFVIIAYIVLGKEVTEAVFLLVLLLCILTLVYHHH